MKFEKVIVERQNKAIYKDGNLAIKVFDENYSKSDILNEALNHARVEETGLNIPKIEEVSKIDGKWAISIDFIEGKTLQELMEEIENTVRQLEQLGVRREDIIKALKGGETDD